MAELLDIRTESELKNMITNIAEEKKISMSDIARDLMWVGIALQKEGGLEIKGPFGGGRPLADIDFGGKDVRLGVRITDRLRKELQENFDEKIRTAAREAIKLGSFLIRPEKVSIEGPFDTVRPFAEADLPELEDKRARKALDRLQK